MAEYPVLTGIISGIVGIIIVLMICAAAYRSKVPKPLPAEKPGVAWLPKYLVPVALHETIALADDPLAALIARLKSLGFAEAERNDANIRFARGSLAGDFSVKIMKIELIFPLPLQSPTEITVQLAAFAAFDTGDLWKFSRELKAKLEAPA